MKELNAILSLKVLVLIIFTLLITPKALYLCLDLLKNAGCSINNYRGNSVVLGIGIFFVPIAIATTTVALFTFSSYTTVYLAYLFAVASIGFVGIIDDLIGDRLVKGLKNHISSFMKGKLTTGFAKAFIGFSSSITLSIVLSRSIIDIFLNTFIIAFFTNTLNLLDLRPGRCIKSFLVIGISLVLLNLSRFPALMPFLSLLIAAMIYLPYDLKEKCMLGDTGSNVLGVSLGFFSAVCFDTTGKIILLIGLLLLNLGAEYFSISKVISSSKMLSYLDNLGRGRE